MEAGASAFGRLSTSRRRRRAPSPSTLDWSGFATSGSCRPLEAPRRRRRRPDRGRPCVSTAPGVAQPAGCGRTGDAALVVLAGRPGTGPSACAGPGRARGCRTAGLRVRVGTAVVGERAEQRVRVDEVRPAGVEVARVGGLDVVGRRRRRGCRWPRRRRRRGRPRRSSRSRRRRCSRPGPSRAGRRAGCRRRSGCRRRRRRGRSRCRRPSRTGGTSAGSLSPSAIAPPPCAETLPLSVLLTTSSRVRRRAVDRAPAPADRDVVRQRAALHEHRVALAVAGRLLDEQRAAVVARGVVAQLAVDDLAPGGPARSSRRGTPARRRSGRRGCSR